jgi:restriction system protein
VARRRSRKHQTSPTAVLLLLAAAAVWWAVAEVVRWAREHPAWAALAGAAVAAAVTLEVWRRVRRRYGRVVAERRLTELGDRTGRRAEELVADLLRRDGYTDVQRTGGGGDLGADVTGRDPAGRRVIIQVKDYSRPIGSPALQTFNGTAWSVHGADRALFVTTSSFTAAAVAFAASQRIELVDRARLTDWVRGAPVGS